MSNADKFKKMDQGLDLVQAIAEADRCLLCHDAPCSEGCPADTKPAEFIRKLRFKNITGAIRTIKENNILGGACGVCARPNDCARKSAVRCFGPKTTPRVLIDLSRLGKSSGFSSNIPGKGVSRFLKNLNLDPRKLQ